MRNKIILFLLLTMLFAKETYKQVRIYYQSPEDLHLLLESGIDIDHSHGEKNEWIEFVISESKILKLNSLNFNYEIIHEDIEAFYVSRLDNDYTSRDFELGSMGGYYTFAEIEQHLDELYADYPELITEKGVCEASEKGLKELFK